jgi:hypothetical protein
VTDFWRPVLLSLGLAACSANPAPDADGVIVRDDFTDVQSGWDRQTSAELTADYVDGRYLIAIEPPQRDVWGLPGLDLNDVRIEVDAVRGDGPIDNAFGVVCRLTGSGNDVRFYYFLISSDGYFGVQRFDQGEIMWLNPAGNYEASPAIQQGADAVNRLSATCQGDHLSFVVNDQPLADVRDGALTHGDSGLIASSLTEGGVRILFDNVIIAQP